MQVSRSRVAHERIKPNDAFARRAPSLHLALRVHTAGHLELLAHGATQRVPRRSPCTRFGAADAKKQELIPKKALQGVVYRVLRFRDTHRNRARCFDLRFWNQREKLPRSRPAHRYQFLLFRIKTRLPRARRSARSGCPPQGCPCNQATHRKTDSCRTKLLATSAAFAGPRRMPQALPLHKKRPPSGRTGKAGVAENVRFANARGLRPSASRTADA